MTPKRPAAAASALDSENALVIVCRGGDCGSRRKHPAVDHAAQLTTIRTRVGGAAEVLVSKCLDACEHSNVIVVVPGQEDRTRGAEPVWLGEVNGPFTPARRSRHELEDPDTVPAARPTRRGRKR